MFYTNSIYNVWIKTKEELRTLSCGHSLLVRPDSRLSEERSEREISKLRNWKHWCRMSTWGVTNTYLILDTWQDLHPKDYSALTVSSLCTIQLWCVIFLHPFLSEAILFILSIVIPLWFILSSASSMYTSLSLFLGRPQDRFPCLGFQSSKYWGKRSSGILLMCPNQ